MKNCVPWLLRCMFFMIPTLPAAAQDIHFSQFFEAPLLRNPALAGLFSGDVRLQAVYRTQWESVTVPYQTVSFNGEYKIQMKNSEDFLTVGGQILYDKAGTVAFTSTHVLPTINYHKSLSDERNRYLSLGFMGGIVQRRIDRSKMTTNSQFDGTNYNSTTPDGETFGRPSYTYLDGSAGMSYNSQIGENAENNFFIGIGYHHFNKASKISFYSDSKIKMAPKWVYSGGARVATSPNAYVTFQADYTKQASYTELMGGAMYTYKIDDTEEPKYLINAGVFMRWKDAIIPVAKLEARPLSISVSYDANISQLSAASRMRGGFEMGLTYQKYISRGNSSREAVRCPRF